MRLTDLSAHDRQRIAAHGISPDTAAGQLELLSGPPVFIRLDRPCTVGDGIRSLSAGEQKRLAESYTHAARAITPLKFVPASGAASRMFKALLACRERVSEGATVEQLRTGAAQDPDLVETLAFVGSLDEFAFHHDLETLLKSRGQNAAELVDHDHIAELIGSLLDDGGLGYAKLPKALLKFHGHGRDACAALEEHLVEAAAYARGSGDLCRLHLTVSPEHRLGFEALLEQCLPQYEETFGVTYEVALSAQKPSTDAIAVDDSGALFRLDGGLESGEVSFRPGGHGALIENLNDIDAHVIFVKNIDNVVPAPLNRVTFAWKKSLAGLLLELQEKIFQLLTDLEGGASEKGEQAAAAFLTGELGIRLPPTGRQGQARDDDKAGAQDVRGFLIDRLDRPLRVCGMVRNTGEPGGGPFWVRADDGSVSAQIVESSQVDPGSSEQQAIFASSTHFNPVDLVCAVRDRNGEKYDLRDFVDSRAAFVVEKSQGGRRLRSLELPGLWNGAMAGWNTVFVEVPIETFNPVKQVTDLLRTAHRPGRKAR